MTLLRADTGEDLSALEQGMLQMAGAGSCQDLVEQGEARLHYYLECLARHPGVSGRLDEGVARPGQGESCSRVEQAGHDDDQDGLPEAGRKRPNDILDEIGLEPDLFDFSAQTGSFAVFVKTDAGNRFQVGLQRKVTVHHAPESFSGDGEGVL